jgi:hypothetical protein
MKAQKGCKKQAGKAKNGLLAAPRACFQALGKVRTAPSPTKSILGAFTEKAAAAAFCLFG